MGSKHGWDTLSTLGGVEKSKVYGKPMGAYCAVTRITGNGVIARHFLRHCPGSGDDGKALWPLAAPVMVGDLMHLLSVQAVVWTDTAWVKVALGTTAVVLTAVYTDGIKDSRMMMGTM